MAFDAWEWLLYRLHLTSTRFDIGSSGQQVHVAFGRNVDLESTRHPCFKLQNKEALAALQLKIWEHFEAGGTAAPMAADKPGQLDSGKYACSRTVNLKFTNGFVKVHKAWNTQIASLLVTMLVIDWSLVYRRNS